MTQESGWIDLPGSGNCGQLGTTRAAPGTNREPGEVRDPSDAFGMSRQTTRVSHGNGGQDGGPIPGEVGRVFEVGEDLVPLGEAREGAGTAKENGRVGGIVLDKLVPVGKGLAAETEPGASLGARASHRRPGGSEHRAVEIGQGTGRVARFHAEQRAKAQQPRVVRLVFQAVGDVFQRSATIPSTGLLMYA